MWKEGEGDNQEVYIEIFYFILFCLIVMLFCVNLMYLAIRASLAPRPSVGLFFGSINPPARREHLIGRFSSSFYKSFELHLSFKLNFEVM